MQDDSEALVDEQRIASKQIVRWPSRNLLMTKLVPEPLPENLAMIPSDLEEQVSHMKKALKLLNGVGIAANQLGYDNRVCICWFNAREENDMMVMINPDIRWTSGKMVDMKEMCLSCDGCVGNVRRHDAVSVTWIDIHGFEYTSRYEGWNARIVQHEVDHLNGLTIIDRFAVTEKFANRLEMEKLQLGAGIVPKRLKKKGLVLKNTNGGKFNYVHP